MDAGTGNGKYLGVKSILQYQDKGKGKQQEEEEEKGEILTIGFDMSQGLLQIAQEKGHDVVRGDCVDLKCWRRGAFVR